MSVSISSGGGGGGITVESDPTALKIASNLSDLADPNQAIVNLGALGDAPNDGTVYGRQSGEWVAAGGGSFTGGTVTTAVVADAGFGAGQAILDPYAEGAPRVYVGNADGGQYTSIYPTSIAFYNYGTSLSINESYITFPDGTQQTTAYTGGGGGGSSIEQRYADAIATQMGSCVYDMNYAAGMSAIFGNWVWNSNYNNNSLSYEYPAFIVNMESASNCMWRLNAPDDTEFYISYVDYAGFIFTSYSQNTMGGYFSVKVYNGNNDSSATSFPVNYVSSPA